MTRHHASIGNRPVVVTGIVMAALGAAALGATQTREPVDQAAIAKIRDEAQNRSQVGALFAMLTDGIGPRLTASPEHKRAAEWARETLAGWGLSNARLEPFEFGRGWALDKLTIEMVEPRYMPLLGYAEAWSPATQGEQIVPVVSAIGLTPDEITYQQGNLKNAAVIQAPIVTNFIASDRVQPARQPDPPPAAGEDAAGRGTGAGRQGTPGAAAGRQGAAGGRGGRQGGAPTAAQALAGSGATVLLKPSRGMHGTVFLAGGRDVPADPLPKIMLAGEHYNLIARLLARKIPVKVRVNVQSRFLDQDRNSYNVLAELPGTDPVLKDQVVMLGAHLDSWHTGTGATDNADGSAVIMEAFRILKTAGLSTKRTLRLALWSGEEQGLLGARAYVRAHLDGDANKAARDKLSVYFNIDPGKGPIYGWYLENNEAVKSIFDAWLAPFQDKDGALKNVRQGIGNTDHLAFIQAGMPGFNPIQDYVDYDVREHHTNADTAERIKEADLKQNAMILASFIYHAANRAEMNPVAGPPMMSRWVGVTIGLLAFVLVSALVLRSGDAGAKANLNFKLSDMNGLDVELSRYAGKPLVVNLWATWCGPCRLEMPQLVALYQQYKDKGLTIVGISIDDSPAQIREFAKEYSVDYPLLVGAGRDDVLAAFGYFGAVPMSIFISADGRITASVPGVATTATWERRIQELF